MASNKMLVGAVLGVMAWAGVAGVCLNSLGRVQANVAVVLHAPPAAPRVTPAPSEAPLSVARAEVPQK